MSGVRLARTYGPGMVKRGWGRILFVSSESALNVPPDMIHYGMTKTANLSVSRGLAKRLAGTGVTVNAILPGPTLSDGLQAMLMEEQATSGLPMQEVAARVVMKHRPSSILQRAATVEEVANLVVYAASPQASATMHAENFDLSFASVPLDIPVAVTVFPGEIFTPPREWGEQTYSQLFYWNRADKGGHFAAFEQPGIFVDELRRAFSLTRASFN